MKITIELDEAAIAEYAAKEIADMLVREYTTENRDTKFGVRKGVEKAIRDLIDNRRDELTEKCVVRAAESLTRRGLPKLLEKLQKEEQS